VCGSVQRSGWRWIIVGHRYIFLQLFCILHSEWKTGVGRRGSNTQSLTFGAPSQDLLTKQRLPPKATEPLLIQVSRVKGPDTHACGFCVAVWRGRETRVEVRRQAGGVLLMRK